MNIEHALMGGIRAPIRGVLGLIIIGGLGGIVPACLITSVPQFDVPEGTVAKGSCMCAFCLDKPFCMDAARTTTKVDDGTCAGDPEHPLMSIKTSSVLDPTQRSAGFFCVPDDGKTLVFDKLGCSTDPVQHGEEQNVNKCLDVTTECIDPAIVTSVCGKTPDPNEPPCPQDAQTGPERQACGLGSQSAAGYANATDQLIGSCSAITNAGQTIPNGNDAQRFCFLSCLDFTVSGHEPGTECEGSVGFPPVPTTCFTGCDLVVEPPPEPPTPPVPPPPAPPGSPSSLFVSIDPERSQADMMIDLGGYTFSPNLRVGGTIAVDLGQECWGPLPPRATAVCAASMSFMHLEASAFTVAGTDVGNISVLNQSPIHGDMLTAESASVLTIGSNQQLHVTADLAGRPGGTVFSTSSPLTASVDWDARTFDLVGFFDEPGANATLSLVLHGKIPNVGPRADAGLPETRECTSPAGARAKLFATASTDPDGSEDLASYVWMTTVNGVPWDLGGSAVLTPPMPIGTTLFGLAVSDRSGVTSYASTSITVVDSTPPGFGHIELSTSCLGVDREMHLFRLGKEVSAPASDICDPTPFVRIVDVVSNQHPNGGEGSPADVVFGQGAFCVRGDRDGATQAPRVYTVTLEVSDQSGNVSQENIQITVPQGSSCTTGSEAPAVRDDDLQCTEG